jgi:hypothetical protein
LDSETANLRNSKVVDQAVESSEMSENYMKAQNGFDISEKPKAQCPGSQNIQSLWNLVLELWPATLICLCLCHLFIFAWRNLRCCVESFRLTRSGRTKGKVITYSILRPSTSGWPSWVRRESRVWRSLPMLRTCRSQDDVSRGRRSRALRESSRDSWPSEAEADRLAVRVI